MNASTETVDMRMACENCEGKNIPDSICVRLLRDNLNNMGTTYLSERQLVMTSSICKCILGYRKG